MKLSLFKSQPAKKNIYYTWLISLTLIIFFCGLGEAKSAEEKMLLNSQMQEPQMSLFSDYPVTTELIGEDSLIKVSGDFYLLYDQNFSYKEFDKLDLNLRTNIPLEITILSNYEQGGDYTYELQQVIQPNSEINHYSFSLRHSLFKQVSNWAIKFAPASSESATVTSDQPLELAIREIKLSRSSGGERLTGLVDDFWKAAPYSPFTVNLLPTPMIYGRPAFVYFLPVFFALIIWLIVAKRKRTLAIFFLLLLWLLFDVRMSQELIKYQLEDYNKWTQPVLAEKSLRTDGSFYAFADWLSTNLPADVNKVSFYQPDNPHFPRIMNYYLYPVRLDSEFPASGAVVVYNSPEITYHLEDKKLYKGTKVMSGEGSLLSRYNDYSFIFIPDN